MKSVPSDPTQPEAEITALLCQIFGALVGIDTQQTLVQKEEYVVLRMQLRNPALDVILKLAGATPMDARFEQSVVLHRLVAAQTAIPVGEVIAADSTCRTWPWRYLLRVHVAGTEWSQICAQLSQQDRAVAHAQIGDAVAQLHGIKFHTFGEFDATGKVVHGDSYIDALHRRVEHTISSFRLRMEFLELLDRSAELFASINGAALCHEDLHKHNWLFRCEQGRWQLATILDFDKAWAGNPESDLARLEFWDGMTSEHFWDAYRQRNSLAPGYLEQRPLYQLLWCLEYARPTARHLADTNKLCVNLGLSKVHSFE